MSRLGAPIPFSQQLAGSGGSAICLSAGGCYYFPSGNYIVSMGNGVTLLQFFDPVAQAWRTQLPYNYPAIYFYVSSDGSNYRLCNPGNTVVSYAVTAAGSGATNGIGSAATGVTVAVAASPSGVVANATAYPVVGGAVAAPTLVQGGSGFVAIPVILVDPPPPGGVQAAAYATLSATGVVTAITLQNAGAGYVTSPNFYVQPQPPASQATPIGGVAANQVPASGLIYPSNLPPGSAFAGNASLSGCQITSNPLTGSGTLTAVGVINGGWGYTAAPVVTVTGAGAATATATRAGTPGVDIIYVQQQVA